MRQADPDGATPPALGTPRATWGGMLLSVVCLLLLAAALAALAPLAAHPVARMLSALESHWVQLDNEEGALLWQAMELSRGHAIYRPLDTPPFVAGTYPPLYMALAAPFVDADAPSFRAGRLITGSAAVAVAAAIALTILIRRRRPVEAILAALLFLCTFEVNNWIAYFRVDMLALAFSVAGVALLAVVRHPHPGVRVAALAFFVLAFLTKQTQLAAPAAVVLWLGAREGWRPAARFALAFAASLAVALVGLAAATRGQFLLHAFAYNTNTWFARDVWVWLRHVWRFYPGIVVAGTVVLAAAAAWPRRGARDAGPRADNPWAASPLPWYMVTSLVHIVAIGKQGSAENYLLEPLAAWALGIGDLLAWLLAAAATATPPAAASARRVLMRAAPLAVCAALLFQGVHAHRVRHMVFSRGPVTQQESVAFGAAARAVRAEKGDTWCELAMLNLLAGRSPHLQPFIMSELARQGRWDQAPFLADLDRRRFALVVTAFDVFSGDATNVYTPEMLRALRANYRPDRIERGWTWNYHLYRPLPPGNAATPGRTDAHEDHQEAE